MHAEEGLTTEAIEVVFHNVGMRSGIECSLCAICPKDRIRGCCTISPVFLMTDIGYFLNNGGDEFVNDLLDSPYVSISADQFMVNSIVSVDGGQLACRFHHPEVGCRIPMSYRNMVCRQFLCPSVKLWQDTRARRWVDFWLYLQEEEIRRQQLMVDECAKQGFSLLARRSECLRLVSSMYRDLHPSTGLPDGYPEMEILVLEPPKWPLAVCRMTARSSASSASGLRPARTECGEHGLTARPCTPHSSGQTEGLDAEERMRRT